MNPHILQQMKKLNQPPEDEGVPSEAYLDGMTPLNTVPKAATGLPELRGSPAQVKWALTIREKTLNLDWPTLQRALLTRITDSTWWIANRTVVNTMKFKPPTEAQMIPAPAAALPNLAAAFASNAERARERKADEARFNEAEKFAESVSKDPKLAKAAVLAVLSKLYRDSKLKEDMRRASRAAMEQADHDNADERDIDAINRMLQ